MSASRLALSVCTFAIAVFVTLIRSPMSRAARAGSSCISKTMPRSCSRRMVRSKGDGRSGNGGDSGGPNDDSDHVMPEVVAVPIVGDMLLDAAENDGDS